jgi:hypothetical protein
VTGWDLGWGVMEQIPFPSVGACCMQIAAVDDRGARKDFHMVSQFTLVGMYCNSNVSLYAKVSSASKLISAGGAL